MNIETDLSPEEMLRRADLARGFAGMLDGRTKLAKELEARGRAMQDAAFDAKFGPIPDDIKAMSVDDILKELEM